MYPLENLFFSLDTTEYGKKITQKDKDDTKSLLNQTNRFKVLIKVGDNVQKEAKI